MANLRITDLSMRYERKYILDDLNLEVESGELLVILGKSGCGKTSLLKIIAGILNHEKGQILVDTENITHLPPQKRNIGYVPQAQVLFPHMKVRDNIIFGLKAQKLSKDEIRKRLSWIANLTQIEDLLDRYPNEISGGQKQRVALARAMAIKPRILLLDEPLSSIDATGRESLALTIRRIQKETETTTLYVTHNQEEARLIGDRVAVMYDGRIQQIGKITYVDVNPLNFLIAKIMGSINVWPVLFKQEKDNETILVTSIGEIKIKANIKHKVTGIKIPPSEVKIVQEEQRPNHDLFQIKGYVKSIIQRGNDLFRVVLEVKNETVEYIKADIAGENLIKELETNQLVYLEIDPKNVVLI
ncbi:MAG: ABC transporter ATP-binding protein [Candidatus Heimdallarchaeaceae archaeon]